MAYLPDSAIQPGDTTPASRASIIAMIRAAKQLVPVANATEQAQVLAAWEQATGAPVSATNPCWVDRADTGSIERHAGAGWRIVAVGESRGEWTSERDFPLPSGQVWGPGVWTLDAAQSVDAPCTISGERLTVVKAGLYNITRFLTVAGGVATARAFLSIVVEGVREYRQTWLGEDNGLITITSLRLSAGQVLGFPVFQNSGSSRTQNNRVVIQRVG